MGSRDGKRVKAVGLVLVRQRPRSGEGVCFITLEDETGAANLALWSDFFENYRSVILSVSRMAAKGRTQHEGNVVHLLTLELANLSGLLGQVGERSGEDDRVGRDPARIKFCSRNFH